MGGNRFTPSSYDDYRTSTLRSTTGEVKSVREVFKSTKMKKDMDPALITMRESRDSVANPNSNAIIIGCDVTGSMSRIVHSVIENIGILMTEVYDRKPVSDPHIMCMGIGDVEWDKAPLQVTQFEADIKIAKQLQDIWIEGCGGGNKYESYILPWLFAAQKTSIDCFEKRNKKGYLFTIGDEQITPKLSKKDLNGLGYDIQCDISAEDLYKQVSEKYEVYHIIVGNRNVQKGWNDVLGQRAITLNDHTKLAQVIVAAIQMNEGMSREDIIASWDDDAKDAIRSSFNLRQ